MGCIEHHCSNCGEIIINNQSRKRSCPVCGESMFRLSDEVPEKDCWDGDLPYGEDSEEE